jgi:hypothetical protein
MEWTGPAPGSALQLEGIALKARSTTPGANKLGFC